MSNVGVAKMCPDCGSFLVDTATISNTAKCGTCSWSGEVSELVSLPFQHSFLSDEEMSHEFAKGLRNVFAKYGADFGRLLLQWGFIDHKKLSKQLPLYMTGMAVGALRGLMQVRIEIEKSDHGKKEAAS